MPAARTAVVRKKVVPSATRPKPRSVPLVDLAAGAFDPETVEQKHVFSIDGTDYYVPSAASASVLVEWLRIEKEDGADPAMWFLLGQLLGPDGVRALRTFAGLTLPNLLAVYDVCIGVVRGPKA